MTVPVTPVGPRMARALEDACAYLPVPLRKEAGYSSQKLGLAGYSASS